MGAEEPAGFDGYREQFVAEVERAREEWNEDLLAEVLGRISEAAAGDLDRQFAGRYEDEEVIAAVDAWASVHSYAITRFYLEGPESILRRGGFSKTVTQELQRAVDTYSPFLRGAVARTGASSFSISVGLPLGVAIALEWNV